jgi:NADH dehydrogenase
MSPERGNVRMSPVHVEDVAQAFVASLTRPETVGQVYALGGPDVLSWNDMIRFIADAIGRRKWILPMPVGVMKIAAALLDWLPFFPVTRDQLTMLAEGNVASCDDVEALIGRRATPFEPASLTYLRD